MSDLRGTLQILHDDAVRLLAKSTEAQGCGDHCNNFCSWCNLRDSVTRAREALSKDAKTTAGGNKTLPRCEVPDCTNQAEFIINERALCRQHRGPIPPSLRK